MGEVSDTIKEAAKAAASFGVGQGLLALTGAAGLAAGAAAAAFGAIYVNCLVRHGEDRDNHPDYPYAPM